MVIKIHIYISKEGHMAGKSFTPLTKKITYNNGTVLNLIKKTYLEEHKKMFFFSTSSTQN